jgi:hypothetical protein
MLCISYGTLGARLLLPDTERLRPDRGVGCGCHAVSARMEVAVDKCVSEEQVLRLLGRREALHLSFSLAGPAMRVLSAIVEIAASSGSALCSRWRGATP